MAIKSRAFSSELLSPVAEEVWKPIFEVARTSKPPSSEGANIAIHLHLVAEALKRQSLYRLTPEVQKQCDSVLKDIFNVCTVCLFQMSQGYFSYTPVYILTNQSSGHRRPLHTMTKWT